MNRARPFALFILAAASLSFAKTPRAAIPDIIRDAQGVPAWVSANAALDADGNLRAQLFGDRISSAQANARLNGTSSDDCRVFVGPAPEHYQSTGSVDDLVRNAKVIVSGRVLEIREGFYYGVPGSLIRLEASVLKGGPKPETLLFYQLARIRTSEGMICAKPLGEFTAPAANDRMLAFSMTEPLATPAGGILWVDTTRQLVHDSAGGRKVFAPAPLRGEDATFDTIERRVGAEIRRPETSRRLACVSEADGKAATHRPSAARSASGAVRAPA